MKQHYGFRLNNYMGNQFGGKKVMKKIMWIVAMIPVVVTSVVLQFMPDIIPMHHDLEGNTDRWGSEKQKALFFPVNYFVYYTVLALANLCV